MFTFMACHRHFNKSGVAKLILYDQTSNLSELKRSQNLKIFDKTTDEQYIIILDTKMQNISEYLQTSKVNNIMFTQIIRLNDKLYLKIYLRINCFVFNFFHPINLSASSILKCLNSELFILEKKC